MARIPSTPSGAPWFGTRQTTAHHTVVAVNRRTMRSVLGTLCLAVALVGCSSIGGSEPESTTNAWESEEFPGAMTIAGMEQALRGKIDEYRWPAGLYLDVSAQVNLMASNGNDTLYQLGREDVILGIANSCAWMEEWATSRANGDTVAADEALSVLETEIPELPAFAGTGEDGAPFADMVANARTGNPEPINRYLELNCRDIPWMEEPAAAVAHRYLLPGIGVSLPNPARAHDRSRSDRWM